MIRKMTPRQAREARGANPGDSGYVAGDDIDLDEEVEVLADGSRLTEARAEQLADEMLESAGHGRVGRPSLSGGSKRSPQLGIRVSEDLHARLTSRAEDEGKRLSDVVREALEAYVA